MTKSFISYSLTHGLLADLWHNEFPTQLYGWNNSTLIFFPGSTYYGYVYKGQAILHCEASGALFVLHEGMYFSLPGAGLIIGEGQGIVIMRLGYEDVFNVGGPVESTGRLPPGEKTAP